VRSRGLSAEEQDELWACWRQGASLRLMARKLVNAGRRCARSCSRPAGAAASRQAGPGAAAAGGGGGQADPAMVTPADRGLVAAGLPLRIRCCGCRTRPSSGRCSSSAAAPFAGSCSAGCARVGRCPSPRAKRLPKGEANSATPCLSVSRRPRRPTGRCPGTGKATWSSAGGRARWEPWSSATATLCCCSRSRTGSRPSACGPR
jgi:hypothetical protein